MKLKKRIIGLIITMSVLSIVGAAIAWLFGQKKLGGRFYQYDNANVVSQVTLSKAVYKKDKLVLTMSGFHDTEFTATCYDENFQPIDGAWTVTCKDGKLTIAGEKAPEICGVVLENGVERYMLRYLDSKQYAILVYYMAEDMGWIKVAGEDELYYTQAELDEQRAKEEAYRKEQEENWALIKGKWVSMYMEDEYIEFYEAGEDRMMRHVYPDDSPMDTELVTVDEVRIQTGEDGYRGLEIIEGIGYSYIIYYELSEDGTVIEGTNQVRYQKQ